MELSNANADPDSLLSALHAERESAQQEAKRQAEQDEDDALVAQYFAKIPQAGTNGSKPNGNGKGKEKALPLGDGVGEDSDDPGSGSEDETEDTPLPAALTVKRRPAPGNGGPAEPSIASILAERGKALNGSDNTGTNNGQAAALAQAKRKREGMQKLLGIKKKKA